MVAKQIIRSNYSTNLTEKRWQVIKYIVEPQERTRKKCLREILNALFYISKSGCQWGMLFPDWTASNLIFWWGALPCPCK
ncbi:MAG: transposase [Bacteroides sp.]|nr:transposase [Bacteroides sp.]